MAEVRSQTARARRTLTQIGCELAMMCDIIYAAENASFGLPEVRAYVSLKRDTYFGQVKIGTIPGVRASVYPPLAQLTLSRRAVLNG